MHVLLHRHTCITHWQRYIWREKWRKHKVQSQRKVGPGGHLKLRVSIYFKRLNEKYEDLKDRKKRVRGGPEHQWWSVLANLSPGSLTTFYFYTILLGLLLEHTTLYMFLHSSSTLFCYAILPLSTIYYMSPRPSYILQYKFYTSTSRIVLQFYQLWQELL